MPDGLIDFGDVTRSWAVARARDHDLVGAAPRGRRAGVGAAGDPGVPRAATAVGGGGRGDLAARRAARRRARRERRAPGAARRRRRTHMPRTGIDREWRIFEQATSVPAEVMTGVIADGARRRRAAAGHAAARHRRHAPRRCAPGFDAAASMRLDVSIGSDAVDAGAWLDPGLEDRLALGRARRRGVGRLARPWRTPRLTASRIHSAASSATVPTGIDVWFAEPRLASSAPAPCSPRRAHVVRRRTACRARRHRRAGPRPAVAARLGVEQRRCDPPAAGRRTSCAPSTRRGGSR